MIRFHAPEPFDSDGWRKKCFNVIFAMRPESAKQFLLDWLLHKRTTATKASSAEPMMRCIRQSHPAEIGLSLQAVINPSSLAQSTKEADLVTSRYKSSLLIP